MIEGEELALFTQKTLPERLSWIRLELNSIYPNEYTPPKVSRQCKLITAQGLRKLETHNSSKPRYGTIKALSEVYDVPLKAISSKVPESFYLGKKGGGSRMEIQMTVPAYQIDPLNLDEKPLDASLRMQDEDVIIRINGNMYQFKAAELKSAITLLLHAEEMKRDYR
jgi:hypothetical protein